jgi:hypothetical protein
MKHPIRNKCLSTVSAELTTQDSSTGAERMLHSEILTINIYSFRSKLYCKHGFDFKLLPTMYYIQSDLFENINDAGMKYVTEQNYITHAPALLFHIHGHEPEPTILPASHTSF